MKKDLWYLYNLHCYRNGLKNGCANTFIKYMRGVQHE